MRLSLFALLMGALAVILLMIPGSLAIGMIVPAGIGRTQELTVGITKTLNATLKNDNATNSVTFFVDSLTSAILIDGVQAYSYSMILDPGESRTVSFDLQGISAVMGAKLTYGYSYVPESGVSGTGVQLTQNNMQSFLVDVSCPADGCSTYQSSSSSSGGAVGDAGGGGGYYDDYPIPIDSPASPVDISNASNSSNASSDNASATVVNQIADNNSEIPSVPKGSPNMIIVPRGRTTMLGLITLLVSACIVDVAAIMVARKVL